MVYIPWSSINLIDFCFTSKEKVDITALFDPKGRHGAWNVPALLTYLLGGADISWLVDLMATAAVYYPADGAVLPDPAAPTP